MEDIRINLFEKYYKNWNRLESPWENRSFSNRELTNMYKTYIKKLKHFINDCNKIQKKDIPLNYNPNYRQKGGFERCVLEYNERHWDNPRTQFLQAYKEMMVDCICYSLDLEYDDISIKELNKLKEMASFLISKAEKNIESLSK